jgi:hypothetical protein
MKYQFNTKIEVKVETLTEKMNRPPHETQIKEQTNLTKTFSHLQRALSASRA